jgi:hypothetical protein
MTGGFYLSTHTLLDSLYGRVHTFVLSMSMPRSEGEDPSFSTFVRRIAHYFHNAFVLDDAGQWDHIPDLSTMDGVGDLFALFAAAMFLNVFDARTYQAPTISVNQSSHNQEKVRTYFDLNAIPVIERLHFCYTRGLVLDLVFWFFDQYSFTEEEEEIDGYRAILIPFFVHVARHIERYKEVAVEYGYSDSDNKTAMRHQMNCLLQCRDEIAEEYEKQRAADEEAGYDEESNSIDEPPKKYDMGFDFSRFTISKREVPTNNSTRIVDFLAAGQSSADMRFLKGLSCQFVVDEGMKSNFIVAKL